MSKSGAVRTAREVLLTTGAVLGIICIIVTLAGFAFGVKPLMSRSGSMAPAIQTGDLAISRTVDSAELNKGDIVSVVNSDGQRVTHRLVSAAEQGDQRQLKLKGDANNAADEEIYSVAEVQRVMFNIPKAGYVVAVASSPAGVFVLGLYVALMLLLTFRRPGPGDDLDPNQNGRKTGGGRKAEKGSRRRLARSAIVLVIAAGTATVSASGPTWAAPWTDDVPITGSVLVAYTVPKPALPSCVVTGNTLSGFTATITWTSDTNPFTPVYDALVVETNSVRTVTITGTSRSVTVTSDLLGSVFGSTVNVRITATYSPSPTWKSVSTNQPLSVGLLGASLTCGTAT